MNFINSIFASAIWSILAILSMVLLTSRSSHVFGWTRGELWLLAGMYNVVMGMFYFLFSKNMDELQVLVNSGKLDSLLLKPIDSQWMVSFWQVSWRALVRIIIGVVFLVYLFESRIVLLRWETLLPFFLFLILGVSILYAISFGFMTITIWITNLSNLRDLLSYIYGFTRYPPEMYRGGRDILFILLFPLTLVLVVPTRILIERVSVIEILSTLVCSFGLVYASRKFWQFALRFYMSASGN